MARRYKWHSKNSGPLVRETVKLLIAIDMEKKMNRFEAFPTPHRGSFPTLKLLKGRALLVLFFPLLFSGCHTRYYVRSVEPAQDGLNMDPSRVALVGFHPYKTWISSFSGNATTYTAELDPSKSLVADLKEVGTPIEYIPSDGIDESIPSEKVNEFIMDYLKEVKRSGVLEMTKMIQPRDGRNFLMKRDVDYYVVGVLKPSFNGPLMETCVFGFSSYMLNFLSAGIVPYVNWYQSETIVYVYDRQLTLLKSFRYKGSYRVMTAYFIPGNPPEAEPVHLLISGKSPDPIVWKPDLVEFRNDFRRFVHTGN